MADEKKPKERKKPIEAEANAAPGKKVRRRKPPTCSTAATDQVDEDTETAEEGQVPFAAPAEESQPKGSSQRRQGLSGASRSGSSGRPATAD